MVATLASWSRCAGFLPIALPTRFARRSIVMGASFSSEDGAGSSNFRSFTDTDWKRKLSPEQFRVARKKGTELAFTGKYWNTKSDGVYDCVCCETPLFDSKAKFDSGTGWPSYFEAIGSNVKVASDWSIPFMPRSEVLCANCDAHLGHVFDDGPPPTGKRYCINRPAPI